MKHFRFLAILFVAATLSFTACDGGGGGGVPGDSVVTISEISGVTPPNYGETPVTTINETAQFTGTVTWSDSPVTFATTTVYTATITLTAKPGYTLEGVSEDVFTVAGATSVSNSADSGVVTAVFPETGAVPDIDVVFQSAVQTGGTSGTANSTGLTLTFDVDPTTLSADNITVTGATKGALSGSGTTRSLAISNITVANGATVSVTITSPTGYTITGSSQSAVVYRAPYIGMPYQGGIIAYILQSADPGFVTGETHGLIVSTSEITSKTWGQVFPSTEIGTSFAFGTGQANITAIVNNQGAGTYAAGWANNYTNDDTGTGVYSDWYLPSMDELYKLYYNRTQIGGFANDYYWSSSEVDAQKVIAVNLIYGSYYNLDKGTPTRARAVRSF